MITEDVVNKDLPALEDHNGWADFWRNRIGVNVIPAVYKHKVPAVEWKVWQTEPIPDRLHNEWKAQNWFCEGMGIVLGHVFHNYRKGQYLTCLDTDNGLATKILAFKPEVTLVQQRKNATDRAHSYFYSDRPVKRKPASSSSGLKDRYDRDEAPKFELRCVGDIVYSGKHQSGFYYEIVGITEPISLTMENTAGLEKKVNDICVQYGLTNSVDQPISDLFKDDYVIYEGENRSRELKRIMLSLLQRNRTILPLDKIKEIAHDWENKHCKPPYPPETGICERNWKQAVDIVINDKPTGDFLEEGKKRNNPHLVI